MSEQQPEQGYYDQERPGDERSLYADMKRSRDFGEKALWSDAQLLEIGNYWKDQTVNPERSPRALKEIDLLLGRTVFEMVCRQNDLVKESVAQMENERIEELA